MEAVLQAIILAISLVVLSGSSKKVVEKAEKLAKFFNISEMAVGFIFIAFLTSLPEFSVAIVSAVSGQNNLSLGDALGSNVTNIALVLGACGILGTRHKFENNDILNMLVLLAISLIPIFFIIDGELSFADGICLLLVFLVFLYFVFSRKMEMNHSEKISKKEAAVDFVHFVIGIALVIASAGFAVDSAVKLASIIGIFPSFIGATVIALSTSLPELAIDVTAVKKGRWGLATGDIMGSCVTNATLIIGTNTVLRPFLPNMEIIPIIILFVVSSVFALGIILWQSKSIGKTSGLALLFLYLIYLIAVSGTQISQVAH